MSDWDADPAMGCGLMLAVLAALSLVMFLFAFALVWSKLT
jgi:hypothetical protein